jgi:hypothetical protein
MPFDESNYERLACLEEIIQTNHQYLPETEELRFPVASLLCLLQAAVHIVNPRNESAPDINSRLQMYNIGDNAADQSRRLSAAPNRAQRERLEYALAHNILNAVAELRSDLKQRRPIPSQAA